MKLNKTWKFIIGFVTAIITLIPVLSVLFWLLFFTLSANATNMPGNNPEEFFFLFIFITIMFQVFWLGLRLIMVSFYQTHAILTESGSKVLRTILSVGFFFFPYFAMPIYYFTYVFPENTPNWALDKPQKTSEGTD